MSFTGTGILLSYPGGAKRLSFKKEESVSA
jgi:hypothetical protein